MWNFSTYNGMDDIIFVQNQGYKLIEPEQWRLSKLEKVTYFLKEMNVNGTNARYNLKVFFDGKYFTSVEIHLLNMTNPSDKYENKIYNFIKFFDVYVDKEVILLPEKIFYDFSKLNQKHLKSETITIQGGGIYNKFDFSKKFSIVGEYNIGIVENFTFRNFNLDSRNLSSGLDFHFCCLVKGKVFYTITDKGIQKCRLCFNGKKDVLFEENKENLPLVFINNRDSKNIYIGNMLYQTKKILEENILNKENLKSVLDGVYFNLYDTSDVSGHLIKIHFKLIDYYLKGTGKEKKDIVKVLEAIGWDYDINLDTFTLYYSNFFNTFIKNIKKNNIKGKLVAITDNLFINLGTNGKLYSLNKKSELILVDDNYTGYNTYTIFQELKMQNKNPLLLKDGKFVGLFKDGTLKIFNKDGSLSKKFDLNSLLNGTKNKSQVSILDCRLSQNYVYIYWRGTGKFIKIDINKNKVEYFDFGELKYTCLGEDKSDELLISKMKNNDYLSLFWLKRDQESVITQTASYYDKFSNKDVSIHNFSDYKGIDTIDYSRFKQYLIFLKADHTDDYDYYDSDNFPFYELQSNCFLCYGLQGIKKSFIIDKRKISSVVYMIREGRLCFLESMLRRYNLYSHVFSFRKYDLENQNQDSEEDFLNLGSKGKLVKKSSNIAVFGRTESLSTNNFYVGLDNGKIGVILPNILR